MITAPFLRLCHFTGARIRIRVTTAAEIGVNKYKLLKITTQNFYPTRPVDSALVLNPMGRLVTSGDISGPRKLFPYRETLQCPDHYQRTQATLRSNSRDGKVVMQVNRLVVSVYTFPVDCCACTQVLIGGI